MITYMMIPKRNEKNYKTIIIIFTDPGMKKFITFTTQNIRYDILNN